MKKTFLFSAVVFALIFLSQTCFAAKVCLQDQFGDFFELKGGKIDKKTFTVKVINPAVNCVIAGYADVTATNGGALILGMFTNNNTAGNCNAVLWSATLNIFFSGSGTFDRLGDGSVEGNFTLTPISCTSLPPSKPNKTEGTGDQNGPFARQ